MRFEAKMNSRGRKALGAIGVAFIHLEETGIIIDGQFMRFDMPITVSQGGFLEIFSAPSRRTIPYSTIIRYTAPTFLRRLHKIIYRLPDGRDKIVRFTLPKKKNIPDGDTTFSTRLEEGRTVARTYLQA